MDIYYLPKYITLCLKFILECVQNSNQLIYGLRKLHGNCTS